MSASIFFDRKTSADGRGMTLVELLITCIITLLLSYALLWMLTAGKAIWQNSITRSSGRQDLQVASLKIGQDVKDTNLSTMTLNTAGSPSAFSLLSAFDSSGNFVTDSSGARVWQKYVIYYIPTGTTKLLRKEIYGSFTVPLTSAQLIADCDGQGKTISKAIDLMSLTSAGGNSVSLTLQLQNTNSQGKLDQQSRTMTIFLRE